MNSRSERHKEYSDSRTDKKNKKKRKKTILYTYTCYLYSPLLDQIKKFSLCSVPIVRQYNNHLYMRMLHFVALNSLYLIV